MSASNVPENTKDGIKNSVEKNEAENTNANSTEDESSKQYVPKSIPDNVTKKLDTLNIEGAAKYLKTCKKVIFMIGAGVSTAAGIPDFRSPETGLYAQLKDKFDLPRPESIFDLDYFKENPKPFYTVSKQIFPTNFKPTISHFFIRLLHEKGHLLRVYSQNIDMLEEIAGIPESLVLNAHGSFKTGHCLKCEKEYKFHWMKDELFKKEFLECNNPNCDKGLVKPDIVFFGESLPNGFFEQVEKDFRECDLLIIMGTSLKVQPFAILTGLVSQDCPRLLINRDPVGEYELLYNYENVNYRDVFLQGDCDTSCLLLAELLQWKNELMKLKYPTRTNVTQKTSAISSATNVKPVLAKKLEKTENTKTEVKNQATASSKSSEIKARNQSRSKSPVKSAYKTKIVNSKKPM